MFFQTEIVGKSRVNGILEPFKVTKHDLSNIASSPPSLLEGVASSQLVELGEIVYPRSQSWERQLSLAVEAVKKDSPELSWQAQVTLRRHSFNLRYLKRFLHHQWGLRWRQEHHCKKKRARETRISRIKKAKPSKHLQ